ncbi:MAG: STAS domain-containing protein [Saprospiraceae bacterium]|nr:STAS domain-containing protein [Saprospiraceae bacterium]
MKFTLDKKETHTVVSLGEENLNSIIAPDLKSEFVFLRNEGVRNLIFNMADVKYVDSSGLSAILTANRLWNGHGAFIISGVDHPAVKKLIEISKLNSILTILPTMTEAVEYIMMEKLQQELTDDLDSE